MPDATAAPDSTGLVSLMISKTFQGMKALDEVSLEIRRGEVHALVGQNGSGKSTLIKVLAGFHQPDPGSAAAVRGRPIALGDPGSAASAGVRFVHQDLGLILTESAVDNLALGYGYHQSRRGKIHLARQRRAAADLMARLGHEIDVDIPVARLSAVERTAVAIARAMQGPPESIALLVLDEPTATMPAGDVEMVYELVRRARAAGAAVLYVSHHLDEVFALADRVTVLRDGHAIATLAVDSSSPGQLADLMSGDHVDVGVRPEPRQADQPLLELRGVSADVLRDLDLTLHSGEIVGVAGVDGSGRDEVAAAIFGGRPRRGEIRCGDTELPACRPDVAIDAGLGYVPGDRAAAGLILDMSIRENFTLPSLRDFWRRLVLNNRRERAEVSAWNHRLGVKTETSEKAVSVLSGGNQQKVVIGKWLRLEPRVLLLDEPTQGVDVAAKADIHRLLDDYAARGAAILVSSSDEAELVRLCSRVLVLDHGRVTAEFAGDQVNRAAIARASLGGQPGNLQQNGTTS